MLFTLELIPKSSMHEQNFIGLDLQCNRLITPRISLQLYGSREYFKYSHARIAAYFSPSIPFLIWA